MNVLGWEEFVAGYEEGRKRMSNPASYYRNGNWKDIYPPYISTVIGDVGKVGSILTNYFSNDKASESAEAHKALAIAANRIVNMWSSKTRAWANGFLWAIIKHTNLGECDAYVGRYLDAWFREKTCMHPFDLPDGYPSVSTHTQEETVMSNHVQYPHVVHVRTDNNTGTRPFVYDLEFFKLQVGDWVVVCDGDASLFAVGKVATIEGPMKFEQNVPPMVVSRIDTVQFNARREAIKNRRKAMLMMQEAAKRNTEKDLFEQVKDKLTQEERDFIATALGYSAGAQPSGEGDGQQRAQAAD